jgi:hypothetical protein
MVGVDLLCCGTDGEEKKRLGNHDELEREVEISYSAIPLCYGTGCGHI